MAGLVYFVVNPFSAKAEAGPSVTVECPPLSEEQRASIEVRTRAEVALDPDPRLWADQILSLTHSLIADYRSESVLGPEEPPSPSIARNESSRPNSPVVTARASEPRESPHASEGHALSLAVGPCAEFWVTPTNLQLGPCATIGVPTSSRSRVALTGGAKWSLARPNDIEIPHWHGGLEANFRQVEPRSPE